MSDWGRYQAVDGGDLALTALVRAAGDEDLGASISLVYAVTVARCVPTSSSLRKGMLRMLCWLRSSWLNGADIILNACQILVVCVWRCQAG